MEYIFDLLAEILIAIPGGFIRWLIFRKKPLKEYLSDDWGYNSIPVIIILLTVVAYLNWPK